MTVTLRGRRRFLIEPSSLSDGCPTDPYSKEPSKVSIGGHKSKINCKWFDERIRNSLTEKESRYVFIWKMKLNIWYFCAYYREDILCGISLGVYSSLSTLIECRSFRVVKRFIRLFSYLGHGPFLFGNFP